MSSRADAAICSIVTSPAPSTSSTHTLSCRDQPDVPDLLEVLGVEGVGQAEQGGQLIDDQAILPVERHVGEMAVLRECPAVIPRDIGHGRGFVVGQSEDLRRREKVLRVLVVRAKADVDADVVQQAAT